MSNADIRLGTNRVDIEHMILSTFLFLNDLALDGEIKEYLFKLDSIVFTSPFRKRIAEKINNVEDEAYSFLSYQIEESVTGTSYEMEWISILAKNSLHLSIVKKYHDDIVEKTKLEELCK